MSKLYQFISCVFHPVITFGLILVLAITFSFAELREIIKWLIIAFSLTYGVIGTYYLVLLLQRRIDIDVKNVKRREVLFRLTIVDLSLFLILTLFFTRSPVLQKILLAALGVNFLYTFVIHLFKFELSVHVGTLAVLVIFLVYYVSGYYFLGIIPLALVIWSRYKLKKHTGRELAVALVASSLIYLVILLW